MAHTGLIECSATHHFVPVEYAAADDVWQSLSLPENVLGELNELDAATDERKLAQRSGSLEIGPAELLFGVPEAQIVNAAFCYPGPHGGRFHDHHRGAWYAGAEEETSMAEVQYHKLRFLREARITESLVVEFQDFLADFRGAFSLLDEPDGSCLEAEPVPGCYRTSQALATSLLFAGSNGIHYPSVRNAGGTCIACFRPALVCHPRRGERYSLIVEPGAPAMAFNLTAWSISA